jgi:predicted Zn-dependent peptidase
MFPNEMFRHSPRGIPDDFQRLTAGALHDYYRDALKHDGVECFIVGDFNTYQMTETIKRHFRFPERKRHHRWVDTERKSIKKPRFVSEDNHVKQARLNIGFRTDVRMDHDLYPAMLLADMYLGGDEHSLLFRDIREDAHLSYYIDSMYFANKGLFAVVAGVDNKNCDRATKRILSVIERAADGDIDSDLFADAKRHVIRKRRSRMDSSRGLRIQHQWSQRLHGAFYDLEKDIAAIEAVDEATLIKAMRTLKLDTVYTLKGDDDDGAT